MEYKEPEKVSLKLIHEIIEEYGVQGNAVLVFSAFRRSTMFMKDGKPTISKVRLSSYAISHEQPLRHLKNVGLIEDVKVEELNDLSSTFFYTISPKGIELLNTLDVMTKL